MQKETGNNSLNLGKLFLLFGIEYLMFELPAIIIIILLEIIDPSMIILLIILSVFFIPFYVLLSIIFFPIREGKKYSYGNTSIIYGGLCGLLISSFCTFNTSSEVYLIANLLLLLFIGAGTGYLSEKCFVYLLHRTKTKKEGLNHQ